MKRYTKDHEWVEIQGDVAVVGISEHAAHELGDITFIELPEEEADFAKGDVLCVIESVKAAADVYAPIAGTVSAIHIELEDQPELVNESAEKEGWLCKLTGFNSDELDALMTPEAYQEFLKG